MRTPETAGFEPATEQALGLLFVSAAARLQRYGVFTSGGEIHGYKDGLPINNSDADYEFTAETATLHDVVPKAAATLGLNSITLSYIPQHYTYNSLAAAHVYEAPTCQFDLYDTASPLSEMLHVYLHYRKSKNDMIIMPVGTSSRHQYIESPPTGPVQNIHQLVKAFAESEKTKKEVGLHNISRRECAALQSIVNHLGTIAEKQAIRRSGEIK